MPFVFLHYILAAIPHVKCDEGSDRENNTSYIYIYIYIYIYKIYIYIYIRYNKSCFVRLFLMGRILALLVGNKKLEVRKFYS